MTQPMVPGYAPPPQGKPQGMAVASMVLGIISIVGLCVWWVAIPCGIIGLALGMVAKGKVARGEGGGAGMAKAGIICSIIGMALAILLVVLALVGLSIFGKQIQKEIERQQKMQQQQGGGATGMIRIGLECLWYNGKAMLTR